MTEVVERSLGVIRADESYPLPLFKKLTGLGDWAFQKAQRRGLKTRRVGRQKFIRGADWAEYLESLPSRRKQND